jgi:AcrR family transcriptional regulator
MLDQTTMEGRIVAAALKAAAEAPWADVTLPDIAKGAGVSLVDLRRCFQSKGEILAAFVRAVDDEVLARAPERGGKDGARDALFEVIMSRFDVLAGYKAALKSIRSAWPADPALLRAMASSQVWMLRAAGIPAEGVEGQLRAAGLGAVYASVVGVWLEDDDPGLARTMAVLDRRLRRGERTLKSIDEIKGRVRDVARAFRRGGKRASAAERTTAPTPDAPPPTST